MANEYDHSDEKDDSEQDRIMKKIVGVMQSEGKVGKFVMTHKLIAEPIRADVYFSAAGITCNLESIEPDVRPQVHAVLTRMIAAIQEFQPFKASMALRITLEGGVYAELTTPARKAVKGAVNGIEEDDPVDAQIDSGDDAANEAKAAVDDLLAQARAGKYGPN